MKYTQIIAKEIEDLIKYATVLGLIVGVLGFMLTIASKNVGLIVVGVMWLIIIPILSHAVAKSSVARLGMIMEISNNVNEIRCILKKTNSGGLSSVSSVSSSSSSSSNAGMLARASQSSADKNVWYCKSCGHKNPNSISICNDCGKSKY